MMNSRKLLAGLVIMAGLTGCSTLDKINPLGNNKTSDYKTANLHRQLDIPPDLTTPQSNDEYSVPQVGGTTYSQYSQYADNHVQPAVQQQPVLAPTPGVLPGSNEAVLKRDGNTFWLSVKLPAQQVWPVVEAFWKKQGYSLILKDPSTGVMQTDWRSSHLKAPQGELDKVLGNLFGNDLTGEMSMYTTRLERDINSDTTEIYISYHGAIEANGNESGWRALPPDPQSELGELMNLLQGFGVRKAEANIQLTQINAVNQPYAIMVNHGSSLIIKEGFKNTWRRIGLALDREDFIVENRNKASGIYYVKYKHELPSHIDNSWLSKIEFWKTTSPKNMVFGQYHVKVTGDKQSSLIQIQDVSGYPLNNDVARKIVALLDNQLK